jgi:hypothetical protein
MLSSSRALAHASPRKEQMWKIFTSDFLFLY